MSRCSPFPPAGYVVKRERYEELVDFIKVLMEKLRKEKKKKKNKWMREKKICDIVNRDLELEREQDEFSNERKRRRRDAETETETNQFEGSSASLISSITEEESDDSTGNNNKKTKTKTTTTTRRKTTSEETGYKHLQQLEMLFPLQQLLDAAASLDPPLNLDWLYPDTTETKTSKEDDEERRRAEERLRSESILSSSWTGPRAQYLHEIDRYALPYVVPF